MVLYIELEGKGAGVTSARALTIGGGSSWNHCFVFSLVFYCHGSCTLRGATMSHWQKKILYPSIVVH